MAGNKNSGRRRMYERRSAYLTAEQVTAISAISERDGVAWQESLRGVVSLGLAGDAGVIMRHLGAGDTE